MKTIHPTQKHRCEVGEPTLLAVGTLRQCPECLSWWHVADVYVSFGFQNEWRRVRWYHIGKRRKIYHAG